MKNFILSISFLFLFSLVAYGQESTNFLPPYKGEWTSPPMHTPNNKVPDGAISGNGDLGVVLGGRPECQELYFSKNDFWKARNGYPNGGVCHLGKLLLESPQLKNASYRVEQQIGNAVIQGNFQLNDGTGLKMKIWCSATRNLVFVELESLHRSLDLNVRFEIPEQMNSINQKGVENGIHWYTRLFNDSTLEWPSGASIALSLPNKGLESFQLTPGNKIVLKIAVCTNHETADYKCKSIKMVRKLTDSRISNLYRQHCDWWKTFWNKSRVVLNDPFLEKYYYASNYLLACCSRNPAFPPGLWGTSLTMDATDGGWAGDYHTNYNYMATWWGAYSSNHVELSEPFDTPILEYMERARSHAKQFLGKKGVYFPVGIGPKGFCSSRFPLNADEMMKLYGTPEYDLEGGYMFLGQKSNSLFCTTNMFMRFYSTYDPQYARKIYPFIRAVADFWEDYLVFENGRYVDYNDNFWEVGPWEGKDFKSNYGDINPTISLGLCRMLFKGIIDVSEYLKEDTQKRDHWKHILDHLSAIPTVKVDGSVRIKACEGGTGSGSRTIPGFGRVMMHGLLFPSGACGLVTDSAFAKVLREEIYRWDSEPVNTPGTRDARWDNLSNGFETYFTSAARVGYEGQKLLARLKERIQQTAYPNLWIYQEGGGVETLSAVPSCINEMLLQSYEGVVRVFPVWPKENAASFDRLRSYGAFLVSSACSKGEVEYVELFSEKGRPCQMENPWGNSAACIVERENGQKEIHRSPSFTIQTHVNEKVRLLKGPAVIH